MTNITIKGEEFEEVLWDESIRLAKLPDEFIIIKNNKTYRRVKKEEPKFPKVFENGSLRITVYSGMLKIEDKIRMEANTVFVSKLLEDWELIKEAIKYAEENQ